MNLNCEYMKIIFMFIIKYFNIRINFLEEMHQNELNAFLRIIDQFNHFYLTYNNPNILNSYNNEYFLVNFFLIIRKFF